MHSSGYLQLPGMPIQPPRGSGLGPPGWAAGRGSEWLARPTGPFAPTATPHTSIHLEPIPSAEPGFS